MKKSILIATAAMAALAMALTGCTPDDPAPASQPQEEVNTIPATLTGTAWTAYVDQWEDLYEGYSMHIVADHTLFFTTDSTGIRHSHSDGAEHFPAVDYTCGFSYTYDSLTGYCAVADSAFGTVDYFDFQYDIEQDALIYIIEGGAQGLIYYRVK